MNAFRREKTDSEFVEGYRRKAFRKIVLTLVCLVVLIVVTVYFILTFYEPISASEAIEVIKTHIDGGEYTRRSTMWWADYYMFNTAIPVMLGAIIAGCGLAAAGSLMQAIMNNPLADPYSTGISSGACLGAVASIVVGVSFATAGGYGIVVNAFIGAMVPAVIIIILARKIHMTPATLILAGSALSYFFNAMITYLMYSADPDDLQEAYLWQVGNFSNVTLDTLPVMAVITVVGSILVFMMSKTLNVMSLGDKNAKALGIDVENFRILCLLLMAVMTAGIVSFTGILGFVGLVSPHIVRLIVGSDNRYVLPISMLMGATLLVVSEYLAVMVFDDIAVGVVVSLIGSPIFFALIVFQRKGKGWYRWPRTPSFQDTIARTGARSSRSPPSSSSRSSRYSSPSASGCTTSPTPTPSGYS